MLIGPVAWMALAGLRALAARETGWAERAQRHPDGVSFAAKVVLLGNLVDAVVPKGQTPPRRGGCLTQWHIHTDLCFTLGGGTVVGNDNGSSCASGSVNEVTQPMMHVWMTRCPR